MAIRDLISALDARLNLSLARFPQDIDSWVIPFPQPVRLVKRAIAVSSIFDEGRPAEPPSQARINALGRLRASKVEITRKDWNLIAWGMCDECGRAGLPIEDTGMFGKIMHFVDSEITKGISRKFWFGLLHSYFSYPQEHPENNPNWLALREKLSETLPKLTQNQTRPKAWSRALERQSELLTDRAGIALGQALFANNKEVAQEIATFLPIPETSWLWRRIIAAQLAMLDKISDERFRATVPTMLALAEVHPLQSNNILAALLTRYESSSYRNEPHSELKQFSLDRWQNPQIKSANRWSLVSDEVRKMMLHWFAKADLEHFFSLLQGEGGVDHARLHYWLKFVDQIIYTRIVMGADAFLNRSVDFTDFRKKNNGRFSQLSGGDSSNNAFIMRIGDYYFVEFSGKGNACYLYSVDKLPFNPEAKNFSLSELKIPISAIDRIIHKGDWDNKANYQLGRLGIFPGKPVIKNIMPRLASPMPWEPVEVVQRMDAQPEPVSVPAHNARENNILSSASLLQRQKIAPNKTASDTDHAIDVALAISRSCNLVCEDHRSKGGAFWILEAGITPKLKTMLEELHFSFVAKRGYWIK